MVRVMRNEMIRDDSDLMREKVTRDDLGLNYDDLDMIRVWYGMIRDE